jgi:hypothetical protein
MSQLTGAVARMRKALYSFSGPMLEISGLSETQRSQPPLANR